MEKGFWQGWIEAPDETERLKMLRTLPPFRRGGVCRYMTATLMESYLKDMFNIARKGKYQEAKQHDGEGPGESSEK